MSTSISAVPKLGSITSRDQNMQKSIYSHIAADDSTDNCVVAKSVSKHLKPKRDSSVDMGKMSPRNFRSMVTTEAYKNVLRDNEKADRLKALIRQD